MADMKYEIVEEILVLPNSNGDYHKELNLIKWFGGDAKYDIRGWNQDRSKMTKGISLTKEEFDTIITAYLGGKENDN